jgi:type I restriction enzyme S subunit
LKLLDGKIYIKHGYAFKGEYFTNKGEYILLTPGMFTQMEGIKLD